MPEPRWFHAVGLGGDGRLYAFGGYVIDPATGRQAHGRGVFSLVVYDPESDTWEHGPEVPSYSYRVRDVDLRRQKGGGDRVPVPWERRVEIQVPHELVGAAGGDGKVYWFGRRGPLAFDPETGAWGQTPGPIRIRNENRWEGPLPPHVRFQAAAASGPDGRIYILGGVGGRTLEGGPKPYDLLTTVDVYDPANDTWTEAAPMRQGRQLFAAVFGPAGNMYVFGGYGHEGSVRQRKGESDASFQARRIEGERLSSQALASVEAYDPAADTWERRSPMPVGVEGMGAALGADGRIYVVGGTRSYSNPAARREVQVYDPRTDTWSQGPSLRAARQGHTVTGTPAGRIYAIGGTNEQTTFLPRMILGGAPGREGAPLASVEVLETGDR